jgi:D-arabinose 1-dehydrogenase-like Zn-dependent alcohol dehydrogenase
MIPETCATAWTCLFRNLEITKSQTLVIRGATSSFGQAAFNMAANSSARVIATTRSQQRFAMLQELSAERVELEGPGFPSASPKPNNSMQCSILSATAQSSTPSPCSAGAAARASQVGWTGPEGPQLGPPGYKINLLYIACLMVLILGGAGPLSIDALRSRRQHRHL